jgi:hypothetical protein
MAADSARIDLKQEAEAFIHYLASGDPCASRHLARLIEADSQCALRPFAEALAARLRDHLHRWAELGITNPEETLQDEVYELFRRAAVDWNGLPCEGRPGEEA